MLFVAGLGWQPIVHSLFLCLQKEGAPGEMELLCILWRCLLPRIALFRLGLEAVCLHWTEISPGKVGGLMNVGVLENNYHDWVSFRPPRQWQ